MTSLQCRDSQGAGAFVPLATARIFVVDDYPAIRTMAATLLTNAGYLVECAESGEEALRCLRMSRERVDLLVTDWNMAPGMSGLELAHQACGYTPTMRVVLMTGEPMALTDTTTWQEGQYHLLCKPFQPVELLTVVQMAFGQDLPPNLLACP